MIDLSEPTHIRVKQPRRHGRGGFVAAVSVDLRTGRVVDATPIMRWSIGSDWDAVKEQARLQRYGWNIQRLTD